MSAEYAPLIGGVAEYTRLLAGQLSAQGVEVRVLATLGCAGEPDDGFQVDGSVPKWNYGVFRALRRMIDEFKPDVVHLQFQTGAYGMHPGIMVAPAWVQFPRNRIGCVTTFHDLREPYLFPKAHLLRRWLVRRMALDSAAVVATNGADAGRLAAMGARVNVIPIGSPVALTGEPAYGRGELHERWGVPTDGGLLGFFGLLNQGKGFDTLLHALRHLRATGREVALLVMGEGVGALDPTNRAYAAQMATLAAELGVTDGLRWTGYLSTTELSRVLRSVDVCVLPFRDGASYRNGTLLAALTNGTPLVTTYPATVTSEDDAFPSLVDGEHARLVPPNDPEALAGVVARLLDDAELRASLSVGALGLSRRFGWEGIATDHAALYGRLVENQAKVAV